MTKETTHPCPELAEFFKENFPAKEVTERLDDILYVLVDYARLNQSSVDRLPNRYYILKVVRDFFEEQSKRQWR
ncbi:MAG: hypothetical protein ACK40G_18540 [Cytophagaceae bacterium]